MLFLKEQEMSNDHHFLWHLKDLFFFFFYWNNTKAERPCLNWSESDHLRLLLEEQRRPLALVMFYCSKVFSACFLYSCQYSVIAWSRAPVLWHRLSRSKAFVAGAASFHPRSHGLLQSYCNPKHLSDKLPRKSCLRIFLLLFIVTHILGCFGNPKFCRNLM